MSDLFDRIYDRTNTSSLKWDVNDGELPMWVADMDFPTAPQIREAISKRAAHGIYGYTVIPDGWYDAIALWWGTRHSANVERDWLVFCTGVIPAVTSCVKRITNVGDAVLLTTPVYDIFFHSVENTGRHVLECPLTYRDGTYTLDFSALEKKLSEPTCTMMILCNPHNPTGNIWSCDDLAHIGALCKKHGVTVLSDEIHCDLTDPGYEYCPFFAASEECRDICVCCISPSKAFNVAGLQSAAVIVPNELLREKISRGLNSDEVAEPNCFAATAAEAAFSQGGAWLDELRAYLADNKAAAFARIADELPEIRAVPQHATYLLWLDVSRLTSDGEDLAAFIRRETGLYLSAGNKYRGNGKAFLRLNVACPRDVLEDGITRLCNGCKKYAAQSRRAETK